MHVNSKGYVELTKKRGEVAKCVWLVKSTPIKLGSIYFGKEYQGKRIAIKIEVVE